MKNTSWFDYIVVLVCIYFLYSNTRALLEVPGDQWGLLEFLMILLSVGFLALGVLRVRKILRDNKNQKQENEELRQRQQQQAEAQRKARQAEEEEDLSWLDEDLQTGEGSTGPDEEETDE